jgi:hypothetical protein
MNIEAVPSLLTVQQFCEKHQAFTPGGIRWLLFHRESNGLTKAIVRVGKKRLLINEQRFFDWLDSQNGRGNDDD